MGRFKAEEDFYHGKEDSLGILIVNLGTPENADPKSVRKFLAEFLSDPRVVEIPRIIWLIILYAFILPRRPAPVSENYKKVWMDEGSPLLVYSERQAMLLQEEISRRYSAPVHVELAMRYGNPSVKDAMNRLRAKGARRLLTLPLYPQYSGTTTATVFDAVMNELKTWRWVPELRWVNQYHDHESYINALATSIEDSWENRDRPDLLLLSFHGIPEKNLHLGDPYHCQCHKTARLVAERLGLKKEQWKVSFQSRFGKAEWLKPATDKTLENLPKEGVKSVDVICPGFSVDCLETLEEIQFENKDIFMEAGGQTFHYIPALNDRWDHINALADIIDKNVKGWPESEKSWNKDIAITESEKTRKRAMEVGAKV